MLPIVEVLYHTHTHTHTITHAVGRIPLNDYSAHRKGRYLTQNPTNSRDQQPCPQRILNPRSQQVGSCRHRPWTTRWQGSASYNVTTIHLHKRCNCFSHPFPHWNQLRWSVAGPLPRRPRFYSAPVNVGCLADGIARAGLLLYLAFLDSPLKIPFHTYAIFHSTSISAL